MFGWFSKPACPVDPETQAWVDHRWRWIVTTLAPVRLASMPVVLPLHDFFPDPYDPADPSKVRLLFDRVCSYMRLDPRRFELATFAATKDRATATSPFRPEYEGAAGLYDRKGLDCTIWLNEAHLSNPLALVATMAHELAHEHLLGRELVTEREDDHEPLTDLLTVYFGMGVIVANAVVQEGIDRMGAYGMSWVSRQGYLDMRTFGYALALFATDRDEVYPSWAKELRPDVRDAFKKGIRWLHAVKTTG
jgi:hypothetical protein